MKRGAKAFLAILIIAAAVFILPRDPLAFFGIAFGAVMLTAGLRAMREERRRRP